MKTILIYFSLAVSFIHTARGQHYANEQMQNVENRERIYYSHKGSVLGCNYAQECRGFSVKFDSIYFDRRKNVIYIRGNIYDLAEDRPISNTEIFIARKIDDRLVEKKLLYKTHKMPHVNPPYDMGKFDVSFKLKKGCFLYICHPSYALTEYDVNKLTKSFSD